MIKFDLINFVIITWRAILPCILVIQQYHALQITQCNPTMWVSTALLMKLPFHTLEWSDFTTAHQGINLGMVFQKSLT